MITKEDARKLYNYYAQIEDVEKILISLDDFIKTQGDKVPDVIPETYRPHGSIEINIPYFEKGDFPKSVRVFNISYPAARRVLKNHLRELKKKVKELNDKLLKS